MANKALSLTDLDAQKTSKPTNTSKLVTGFIKEIAQVDDKMEPLKEARADLVKAAKDNGLNSKAIANAVKFYRAESEKRLGMAVTAKDTETYLSFINLSLFD